MDNDDKAYDDAIQTLARIIGKWADEDTDDGEGWAADAVDEYLNQVAEDIEAAMQ